MIDWLSLLDVPLRHDQRLFDGRVMCIDRDGEIEWQSDRWLAVEGSHESRVQLRTSPRYPGLCIDVSGNPAKFLQGRKVSDSVRVMVVPGSQQVKRQAEAEGLDEVFKAAGAEWREAGCSMCIAMNGDQLAPGEYAVSTSNRNFEGRQGKGGRTFLASPLTAAATALTGVVTDPRTMVNN